MKNIKHIYNMPIDDYASSSDFVTVDLIIDDTGTDGVLILIDKNQRAIRIRDLESLLARITKIKSKHKNIRI